MLWGVCCVVCLWLVWCGVWQPHRRTQQHKQAPRPPTCPHAHGCARPLWCAAVGCGAGVYPFAGHECARAFALISTDLKDCNDNLSDLGYAEKESLREWEAKFRFKYPIVGKVVS